MIEKSLAYQQRSYLYHCRSTRYFSTFERSSKLRLGGKRAKERNRFKNERLRNCIIFTAKKKQRGTFRFLSVSIYKRYKRRTRCLGHPAKKGARSMRNPTITNLPMLVRDIPINLALSLVYCPVREPFNGGNVYLYPSKCTHGVFQKFIIIFPV